MLDVICWKWRPPNGYRSTFTGHNVNVLRAMVARHYRKPHRFSCITDDASGIDGDIRIIPLWDDWANVPSPHGGLQPACYRRLKAWSAEAADIIGPRFVSLDLDAVICGDMSPVWDRPEDCVMWADALNPQNPYNGSMWLQTAGARPDVWRDFEGAESARLARAAGFFGSDQAWYAYKLARPAAPRAATWNRSHGVYSWRVHLAPASFGGITPRPTSGEISAMRRGGPPPVCVNHRNGAAPPDARVVFFHGAWDPWHPRMLERFDWIREAYRLQ